MELFIEFFDPHSVGVFFLFAGILFLLTLLVTALDLITGVRRAKKEGVYRTSRKLRRTIEKISTYCIFLILCLIGDSVFHLSFHLLNIHWFANAVPIIMTIEFLYILVVEMKSVIENTMDPKDKQTLKGATALLEELIHQYGPDIVRQLSEEAKQNAEQQ